MKPKKKRFSFVFLKRHVSKNGRNKSFRRNNRKKDCKLIYSAIRFELEYAVQQGEAPVSIPWLGTFVEHVNMNGLAIRIGYEF